MSDMVRRKTINLDGAEFIISNLSFKQTRKFAAEENQLKENDVQGFRDLRLRIVAENLNRASVEQTSPEILDDTLDPKSLNDLYREILAFSGLRVDGGASPEKPA